MVPSSPSKTHERGFHALREMFKPLGMPLLDCFIKDDVKQSSMHRDARKDIASHIRLKEPLVEMDEVVLIDDVCTTGKSLEACKRLLDPYTNHLEIFTLSIHSSWLKTK
jgi:predicted amidophosphoribosyltransferase